MIVRIVLLLLLAGLPSVARAGTGDELDLSDLTQSFSEDFDSLDVSAWGPGTRWIAHTPWNGDFGAAAFADPKPGFPFTTKDGELRIEVAKGADGKWRSGLLASVDRQGKGFAQQFGYFEMRARFPAGKGLWPAFWLIGLDRSTHTSEVDVVEHYGHMPGRYTASIHVWDRREPKKSRTTHKFVAVPPNSLYEGFHTYGVKIDSEWTRFYFDRREVASVPTPAEHRQPMYLLIDLGLGPGWPIDETPNPSFMYVDYVRAWRKR
jgi:beta-glucanase (GH16 family)